MKCLVRKFRGTRDHLENAEHYIDEVVVQADLLTLKYQSTSMLKVIIFRNNLEGEAARWYRNLDDGLQVSWRKLEAAFKKEFPKVKEPSLETAGKSVNDEKIPRRNSDSTLTPDVAQLDIHGPARRIKEGYLQGSKLTIHDEGRDGTKVTTYTIQKEDEEFFPLF